MTIFIRHQIVQN